MSRSPTEVDGPRLLVIGGCGGLVGRALLNEFGRDHRIRSVHRHPAPEEIRANVEWVRADARSVADWRPILNGVDIVVNVAWLRAGSDRKFRPLTDGLVRLVRGCESQPGLRLVHLSVPPATLAMEHNLPYLIRKREVDAAVRASTLPYSIVCPTMLFGPRDKLLTVMLRTMARWRYFPLFGDGSYHVSPISAADLARIVRAEARSPRRATVFAGGPVRYEYRELTDRMFGALGLPPRYWRWSARGGRRVARVLEMLGSTLLYPYEVDWLVADLLGLPPFQGLDGPLETVDPFLRAEAARLRPGRAASGTV